MGGVNGEPFSGSSRKLARRCLCNVFLKIAVTNNTK
jgi:hypothetical protein